MITAIVGKPGSGKSYYAVSKVLADGAKYKHVSMLLDGVDIPGVRVLSIDDVAPIAPGGSMRQASDPRGWVRLGDGPALLVLDEAQRIWGTQGGKGQTLSQVHREFFQQHRHYSVDVVLIAQAVGQITTQLAVLVDRTIEVKPVLKKLLGGSRLGTTLSLRYREGADDEGRIVAREVVKVDQRVFAHYRSYDGDQGGDAPALTSGYGRGMMGKVVLLAVLSLAGFAAAIAAVLSMTGWGGGGDGDAVQDVLEAAAGSRGFVQEGTRESRGVVPGSGGGIICNDRGCSRI